MYSMRHNGFVCSWKKYHGRPSASPFYLEHLVSKRVDAPAAEGRHINFFRTLY